MKAYLLIFSLLVSGLAVKAQTANNTVGGHPTASGSASASGFGAPGCVEVGGSISYTSASESLSGGNNGTTTDIFTLAPYVGYFPVNGFELGLNPVSYSNTSLAGFKTTSLHALFAPAYNFNTNTIVHFFVEGEIGLNHSTDVYYSESETGLSYGGRIGVKLEIAPHAMLNIFFQYLADQFNYNADSYGLPASNTVETGTISNIIVGVGFTTALYK